MRKNATPVFAVLPCLFLFTGCGGNAAAPEISPQQIVPVSILSISPASVPAGTGDFTLTITGTGLGLGTNVNFGTASLKPNSATSANCSATNCEAISVLVPAQDVAIAGTISVTAANASQVSNSFVFTVMAPGSVSGAPRLLVFSPMLAPAGLAVPLLLDVLAENVAPSAVVNFGSLTLTPSTTSTSVPGGPTITSLQVQVPLSAVATAAEITLSVTNPGASGGTSNPGNFFVVSRAEFPIDESASSASPPLPGNGASTHSSMTLDALFVAFDSTASNLVPAASTGLSQIYVRQNCFAVTPNCASPITLVSVAPDGSPGAGGVKGSDKPSISLDGRFILFESDDTNLVPGVSQPVEQIYLRDTCQSVLDTILASALTCTPRTILVSASPSGAAGDAPSTNPVLAQPGLFVAFQSAATNLVAQPVPSAVQQIYLQYGCGFLPVPGLGCQTNMVLASVDATGAPGNRDSTNPALDFGGLVLAFQSLADNIVASTPANGFQQVYLRATCVALSPSTAPCKTTAQAASVDANGSLGTGDSITPAVDSGGSLTLFATRAPNLLPANTASQQIVEANTCFGVTPLPCTAAKGGVISVDENGVPGQGDSSNPVLGGILRLAFTSQASLVSGVTGQQVYAGDVCTLFGGFPCTSNLVLVSSDANGHPVGGDHAALDLTDTFASFSSQGTGSAQPTQILLVVPFF